MTQGRVLVIDDEYGVRSGITQILQMEGYEVDAAETGRQALELLSGRGHDVALIDYQLPDVDGLTLLQALRGRSQDLATCMITAYANIDTAIAATRQGIDFFLPKPFTPDDLLGVVETLLRHKRLKEEAERLARAHEASLAALATEKSQSHALVSTLRDAVLVVNRDGEVALANQAMARLLSRPEAELLRRPAREALAAPALAPLLALLDAPGPGAAVELEAGGRAWVASVAPFSGDDGAALGVVLTLADITEVRRLAMEKARFVRTMVHELKSPLGAIRSMLEVAVDRSLGDGLDPYVPFLSRSQERIDALVVMISDLLSLTKLEQERAQAPAAPVDVAALVAEALEALGPKAAGRGVALAAELAPDLPGALLRDDDLRTLLRNLVDNAIKYNREGGRVTVRARRQAAFVQLCVEDTGLGIAAENVPRVFDEFFREKRRETREIEGNGLGLAIVKRLVERAGGRLELQSRLGEGSTFTCLLPAAP